MLNLPPAAASSVVSSLSEERAVQPPASEDVPPRARNRFFPLVSITGALFIVTILALVATLFGNPRAPINRFLDRYGGWLIGVEVCACLGSGLLAFLWEPAAVPFPLSIPNTLPPSDAANGGEKPSPSERA